VDPLELWRASLAASGRRPAKALVEQTAAWLADPDLLVEAEPDGFAAGRLQGDVLVLETVVVAPGARRRGLGASLADALADRAYGLGARTVRATWEQDHAFLEACGLTREGATWVGELEPPVSDLAVRVEGLRLGQVLKLAELVETGSEAKALLADGGVVVNGEAETRRGRQVADGDVVEARGRAVRVRALP
jgi:ribosome-associated protein